MNRRLWCLWAGGMALGGGALAQTRREQRPIYRCGNTVSDRPCGPEAEASAVGFDQPSEADRRAAAQRARAEQARAAQRQKEREAAERAALRANTPRPPPPPPPAAPEARPPKPEPRVRHARGPKPAQRPQRPKPTPADPASKP